MAEPDEINERYLARAIKAMNALGDKGWQPKNRERSVSQALRAYAHFATSADKGAVRVLPND